MASRRGGEWAAGIVFGRQRRRLAPLVQRRLVGEEIEDFAIAHRWSTTWPSFTGIALLFIGAILGSANRMGVEVLPSQSWFWLLAFVVGFSFLLIGAFLIPAVLIVTTADDVVVFEARRGTYAPGALLDRTERSSWTSQDQIKSRGLFVPSLWRKHLPAP